MDYDNTRDRYDNGMDAGNIIDGIVRYDELKQEYVIVDDDGVGFSIQELLKSLDNKKVRITCISFEAMINIENMLKDADVN